MGQMAPSKGWALQQQYSRWKALRANIQPSLCSDKCEVNKHEKLNFCVTSVIHSFMNICSRTRD